MSKLANDIKLVCNRISSHILELQRLHRELDRIGRIFRDIWSIEITDLLTKYQTNPTDLTEEEQNSIVNYRGSGRTALQWSNIGVALYRLHTLLEPQDPVDDLYDPTLNASDIAVLSMDWISGGNESTEPINIDVYDLMVGLSKIVFELEYDVEIYDAKVKSHIDALDDPDSEDGYTGRERQDWQKAIDSITNVYKVMFGETVLVKNDQAKNLNKF